MQPGAPEPQSWACGAHRTARRHSRPSGRRPLGGRTAACPRWPPWKGLFPRSRFPQQPRTPPANVSCAACSREPWLGRATRGPRAAAVAPSRSARGRGSLSFLTSFSRAPVPGAPDPGRQRTGPYLYRPGWRGSLSWQEKLEEIGGCRVTRGAPATRGDLPRGHPLAPGKGRNAERCWGLGVEGAQGEILSWGHWAGDLATCEGTVLGLEVGLGVGGRSTRKSGQKNQGSFLNLGNPGTCRGYRQSAN